MQLFDAHSHMHMGPRGLEALLESIPHVVEEQSSPHEHSFRFGGAAIMSTVPEDYRTIDSVVSGLQTRGYQAVPCYGIHPWFLYDVLSSSSSSSQQKLDWLEDLQQNLIDHPDAIVGEIGLDGSRWVEVKQESQQSTTSKEERIWKRERVLACPMDLQREAFEQQLILAVELQRPVSIHVVNAWGELFAAFDNVCARMKDKQLIMGDVKQRRSSSSSSSSRRSTTKKLLPPKIYFHAYSGKVGTLPSIIAACKKGHVASEDVYFGFPPAIPNFNSAKTPLIMKEIGIKQLLLETDLEDATTAMDDLIRGVSKISNALGMEESEVTRQTVENSYRFYNLS